MSIVKPICKFKRGYQCEWLNNSHINFIMNKYIKINNPKDFHYYNTVSADYFSMFPKEVDVIQKQINKGICIGIIFNTDPIGSPGKHWVAVFLSRRKIIYFDSNANPPNKYLHAFLKIMKKNNNITKIIIPKKSAIQRYDGTCGDFSILFLILNSLGNGNELNQYNDIKTSSLIRLLL